MLVFRKRIRDFLVKAPTPSLIIFLIHLIKTEYSLNSQLLAEAIPINFKLIFVNSHCACIFHD